MIRSALDEIGDTLALSASTESVRESRRMVEEQLGLWADEAEQNRKESEKTIADLLLAVNGAAASTGSRNEKFSREIGVLSDRLRKVAGLESLPLMRRSITENVSALGQCVTRMTDEGRESVRKLTSQVAEYQTRLLASESRAQIDPLTGLYNRRGLEQQLELRIRGQQPFSLIVADLNGFKSVNDQYGHLAGDEILKKFAGELKAQFLPDDRVARWGGDEFVGLVAGSPQEGAVRADQIRQWVLGEFRITIDNQTVPVILDAALGTTAWNGVETALELFGRADKEMYRAKQESKDRPKSEPAIAASRTSTESGGESQATMARPLGQLASAVSSAGSSVPSKRK
jgi:diguanylate cyclase